jgi:ecotin
MTNLAFIVVLACVSMVTVAAANNMKAFPAAEKGMVRYVLALPEEENEANLKVELLIGKTVQVDAENKYFFGGKVETRIAQGWGFTYYLLPKLGPLAGTLMAVDPNAPKIERFITIRGEPLLLRYNSKLPMVVYVPEGVEVRYRLWSAPAETNKMTEG